MHLIISFIAAAAVGCTGHRTFLQRGSPPEPEPAAIVVTEPAGPAKGVAGKERGGRTA